MKTSFSRLAALIALAFAAAAVDACSSKADPCTQDQCMANNVCAGEPAACRLKCNVPGDCPEGYACRTQPSDSGAQTVCVAQPVPVGGGGYLTSCAQNLGADCAEGFVCNGAKAQLDATCTKLDGCSSDAECPASQWCSELHRRVCASVAPDNDCRTDSICVTKYGAGYKCVGYQAPYQGQCQKTCTSDDECTEGGTCRDVAGGSGVKRCYIDQAGDWCDRIPDSCPTGYSCRDKQGADGALFAAARACVNRDYCAPCTESTECATASACIADANGAQYCSPQCAPDSPATCPPEAACQQVAGEYHCVPRAGSCRVEAPTACSPCRVDDDCGAGGYCNENPYSGERSCLTPCDEAGKCPEAPGGQPMTCCASKATCGALYKYCQLRKNAGVPDPRSLSGCWVTPCTDDATCTGSERDFCYPGADICFTGRKCSDSSGCDENTGETCDPNGFCRPASCTTNADCPPCSAPGAGCPAGYQDQLTVCQGGFCLSAR